MPPFSTLSDALDFFDQFMHLEEVSFILEGGDAYTLLFDGWRNAIPVDIETGRQYLTPLDQLA